MLRKVFSKKSLILTVSATLFGLLLTFNFISQVAAKESKVSDIYQHLKLFTDVLALVEKNYVESVDVEQLVEGAVKGMLLTLDPHSGYMNKDVYKELQVETKGKFGGLGIEITVKNGLLTVVSPIEDSPATRAGVLAGDQIIKIGDEFTKDLSLIDAVKKLRGPQGTPVILHVHREGVKELLPITVIRDIIRVKSVRNRMLDAGFGYIRLAQFQEGSATEFTKALNELDAKVEGKKLKGLVLDLRNNPGGLLTEAIRIGDIFLKDGVIVYTEGRLESQKQKYYAHNDGSEPEYPIITIINGGSASASEIVSGALQDAGRSLILGQQSFGKGSVQTILPMDRGDALRLTTALYFTPAGRSIQAQGVTPDIVVSDKRFPKDSEELLDEDESKNALPKERDLPGALKNPNAKPADKVEEAPAKPKTPGAKHEASENEDEGDPSAPQIGSRSAMEMPLDKLLKEDPQLDEALRLLKTWHVFHGKPAVQATGGAEDKQAVPDNLG